MATSSNSVEVMARPTAAVSLVQNSPTAPGGRFAPWGKLMAQFFVKRPQASPHWGLDAQHPLPVPRSSSACLRERTVKLLAQPSRTKSHTHPLLHLVAWPGLRRCHPYQRQINACQQKPPAIPHLRREHSPAPLPLVVQSINFPVCRLHLGACMVRPLARPPLRKNVR